jgi:hypothetical protein
LLRRCRGFSSLQDIIFKKSGTSDKNIRKILQLLPKRLSIINVFWNLISFSQPQYNIQIGNAALHAMNHTKLQISQKDSFRR